MESSKVMPNDCILTAHSLRRIETIAPVGVQFLVADDWIVSGETVI